MPPRGGRRASRLSSLQSAASRSRAALSEPARRDWSLPPASAIETAETHFESALGEAEGMSPFISHRVSSRSAGVTPKQYAKRKIAISA